MTVQEIIYKLKNDFPFLVSIIVKNNPDAVRANLSQMIDANYENTESMINAILDLQEGGQTELVQQALRVPFLVANASPNLILAWEQVKAESKSKVSTSAMRGLSLPSGGYQGVSGSEQWAGGDENGGGSGFAGWSGGLFDAIGTIGSAWLGGQSGQQPGYGGQMPFYGATPQPQKKSYTLWIVIGVMVVLGIVAFVTLRKR